MQDISNFKVLSQVEHVKKRSYMYIGDVNTRKENRWIISKDGKCEKKEVTVNDGLNKIISEVIDNAIDNAKKDPPTKKIIIDIKNTLNTFEVRVVNDGNHIPVEKREDGQWLPHVLFGVMNSGSNFDDSVEREGIGQFGLGVKLTNIFSEHFEITCHDPINHLTYNEKWTNGMTKNTEPVIKKKKGKPKEVTNVYFKVLESTFKGVRFEDLIDVFRTRLIELVATLGKTGIKICFNDEDIKAQTKYPFKHFISRFSDSSILYEKVNDHLEYGLVLNSCDTFEHHSFVNDQLTSDSRSSHTKLVTNKIVECAKSLLGNKNSSLKDATIKNKLHVFVNLKISKPQFSSQTKDKLTSKLNKITLNEDAIKRSIKNTGIYDQLVKLLFAKNENELSDMLSSSKKKKVKIPKLIDAKHAGMRDSHKTTLFLSEGDSAISMFLQGATIIGTEYNGGFPLKGKCLNVTKASKGKASSNKELVNLIEILGLRYKMTYETEEERKTLRYGKVCLLVDADVDATHITFLFLNTINTYWPNLLKNGYIYRFITPYVKAIHKTSREAISFFNTEDYQKWESNQTNMDRYLVKSYKGLATSTRKETLEYFKDLDNHLKVLKPDDNTDSLLKLLFDKKMIQERKQWLTETKMSTFDYTKTSFNISTMCNTEMLAYSEYSIQRSIPNLADGLKTSTRKIVFTALKRWAGKSSSKAEIRVSQLAGEVSLETKYHHGEKSLNDAIICMAQDFTGTNNLPLLEAVGFFGSRYQNGQDAGSPRYVYTRLPSYVENGLFCKEDLNLLTYNIEDNTKVEPTFYLPTIPLCLVNGCQGIATGFTSTIQCFNPLDIIQYILMKCQSPEGVAPDNFLKPWYFGFKGTVQKVANENAWLAKGVFKDEDGVITITELPVGTTKSISLEDYEPKVLKPLVENGTFISVESISISENERHFVCRKGSEWGNPSGEDIYSRLSLVHKMHSSCYNLLNPLTGKLSNFSSPEEIINQWYGYKIELVEKRKHAMLKDLKHSIEDKNARLLFITGVQNGTIVLKETEISIQDQMKKINIKEEFFEPLLRMQVSSFTKERVEQLKTQIEELQNQFNKLSQETPAQLYEKDLYRLMEMVTKYYTKRSEEIEESRKDKRPTNKRPTKRRKKN